jgi:Holliday junction resolvase-like predicted endonuclease
MAKSTWWPKRAGSWCSPKCVTGATRVTAAKRARLVAAARLYLARRPETDCRFDVLLLDALEASRVHWIRNAFTA